MILITGAAGFIGHYLLTALRGSGLAVRGVDDLSCSPWRHPPEGIEISNVLDLGPDDLRGVDAIVHLAAHKSVPESFVDRTILTSNIDVDRHLLDLVCERPIRRVILATSCEVYGDAGGLLAEDRRLRPRSPYAVGKVATEMLANLYSSLTTTEICCARLFNTFGPGEGLDAVVPRFVHDAINSGQVCIEGDGRQRRYFSYIEPVVSILRRLLFAPAVPPVVNVAAGEQLSILDLAHRVRAVVGSVEVVHVDGRPNEIPGFDPDLHLLEDVIGATPRTPLLHALAACVEWARTVPSVEEWRGRAALAGAPVQAC